MMKVNNHISFGRDKAPELVDYLDCHDIPFKATGNLVTFDISQNSPHWKEINNIVEAKQLMCLSDTTFSKKELTEAEWIAVRSKWLCGYPQPEKDFSYRSITYDSSCFCELCGIGLRQKAAFRLKSVPKWGNRHFMMLNWVQDELFVDDCVKGIFQKEQVSGCDFVEVHDLKGEHSLPGIYQLVIRDQSAAGVVEQQESIQNVYTCSLCGRKKYHPSGVGMYSIKRGSLDNMPDICRTAEAFGWGKSSHRQILIRQAVYQSIIANNLDRGLVFSVVDLV